MVRQHRGVSEPVLGDAPQAEVPPPTGRKADHDPLKKTVRDIALSMGVVAGIIFLILAVSWRPQPDPVRSLDPTVTAQAAAAAAPYPILLPRVADGWRATSARFEPTAESDERPVWFNGWVTPADQFVAVVQSANTTESFIEEQTITAIPAQDAPATPGWDAVISPRTNQRSLVRVADGVTTIVTGSVGWAELVAFRDSLEPAA